MVVSTVKQHLQSQDQARTSQLHLVALKHFPANHKLILPSVNKSQTHLEHCNANNDPKPKEDESNNQPDHTPNC